MTLKRYWVDEKSLSPVGAEPIIYNLKGEQLITVLKAADVEPLIDASMRRQEALAENVNEGLLTIRALTDDIEHAGLEFAQQHQQMAYDNERLHGEVEGLKQLVEDVKRYGAEQEAFLNEKIVSLTVKLVASQEQWRKTNQEFEHTAKALTKCTQELAVMTQERDQWKEVFERGCDDNSFLKQQLTAMTVERDEIALRWQARVRVLEEAVNACIMRLTLLNQHGPLREQCERALGASVAAEGR